MEKRIIKAIITERQQEGCSEIKCDINCMADNLL